MGDPCDRGREERTRGLATSPSGQEMRRLHYALPLRLNRRFAGRCPSRLSACDQ